MTWALDDDRGCRDRAEHDDPSRDVAPAQHGGYRGHDAGQGEAGHTVQAQETEPEPRVVGEADTDMDLGMDTESAPERHRDVEAGAAAREPP